LTWNSDVAGKDYSDVAGKDYSDVAGKDFSDVAGKDYSDVAGKDYSDVWDLTCCICDKKYFTAARAVNHYITHFKNKVFAFLIFNFTK